MHRKLLFLASLLVPVLSVKAAIVSEMVPLVHPELVNEDESWLDDGYVVDWREFDTPTGVTISINEWKPKTGQIRLDQTSGQFSSNFTIYNTTPFSRAIVAVEILPSSGRLKKEDLQMTAGSFPYTFEQEAEEEGNGLIWYFNKNDDVREFRIEANKPEQKNGEQVVVPFISVWYESHRGSGGKVKDDELKAPQPIEPEEPTDTLVTGDPEPEPEVNEKDKKELWKWIGQLDPTQPETPDTRIGDNWDLTGPVPPGTEDVKIKKHLLDQLTEEELGAIRAKYGEDMEYACRNWSKDIPKIKREQSAECLEILGRTPYSELMKFIQGFIENIMMGLADGADLWNSALGDNSHSNYEGLSDHMPLLGEDYEEFRKNPTDAGWQEFSKKADEKVPFADVVIEYDLWDYIYLNIEVEGLD